MSIPEEKYKDIAFGTNFSYLHIIKEGKVTMNVGTVEIPLPEGYDVAFYRVYNTTPEYPEELTPVGGYFNTGSDARIVEGNLVITYYSGGAPVTYPDRTFHYFIYGGDYGEQS